MVLDVRIKDIPPGMVFFDSAHFLYVKRKSVPRGATKLGTGEDVEFDDVFDSFEICNVYLRSAEARDDLEATAIRVQ